MVSQGYNQEEGINYDETYALVVRMRSICMFLAFSCFNNFIPFQIKSAFLNDYILEEVYVKQSLGFKSHNFPNYKDFVWSSVRTQSLAWETKKILDFKRF